MRIVLDTNVIIAAFAARGLCSEVFEVILAEHRILLSKQILTEVQKNLKNKLHLPPSVINEIINYLLSVSEIIGTVAVEKSACRDKNDTHVLGTALSGKADIIVTGDDDLLVIKRFKNIDILSPREFWERLIKQL
ncbi:MAG: putative toxin-antitoxin system toxin component, PIN family [Nitrospirae bacterium]|jgi:putative PIN family toxin of toxin-antitoxin system|nr:putative toxin-antitoxin system toxin component, PIN family [Nitrospirota bacterium]